MHFWDLPPSHFSASTKVSNQTTGQCRYARLCFAYLQLLQFLWLQDLFIDDQNQVSLHQIIAKLSFPWSEAETARWKIWCQKFYIITILYLYQWANINRCTENPISHPHRPTKPTEPMQNPPTWLFINFMTFNTIQTKYFLKSHVTPLSTARSTTPPLHPSKTHPCDYFSTLWRWTLCKPNIS